MRDWVEFQDAYESAHGHEPTFEEFQTHLGQAAIDDLFEARKNRKIAPPANHDRKQEEKE